MLGGWVSTCSPHHPQKRSAKTIEIRKQGREYPTSPSFGVPLTKALFQKPFNLGEGEANPRNNQFRLPLTFRYHSFSPIDTMNTYI